MQIICQRHIFNKKILYFRWGRLGRVWPQQDRHTQLNRFCWAKRAGGAKKHTQANKSALRAPRALCCLTLSNPIRMAALALVEWKYPFAQCVCVCVCSPCAFFSFVCFQDDCFLDLRPLSPLIYSFYWPSLQIVLPLVCPNHFLKMIPMPPTTIWWVYYAIHSVNENWFHHPK